MRLKLKKLLILTSLLLGACTNIVSNYVPYTVEITDIDVFNSDLEKCKDYAINYMNSKDAINTSDVLAAGSQAALSNAATAIVSPAAVGISGLGGASSEALSELGVLSNDGKRIVSLCLRTKGQQSKSYLVLDPILAY